LAGAKILTVILEGLKISIQGLLVTFLALGLFVLIMIVLLRVFPFKPEIGEGQEMEEEKKQDKIATTKGVKPERTPGGSVTFVSLTDPTLRCEDEEIAAAITVAIHTIRAREASSLGAALIAGKGRWWADHRIAASQGSQVHIK
jgi:hypothetical protein